MEASLLTTVAKVKEATARALKELPVYEPQFGFRIGWASSYEELFRGAFTISTPPDALLHAASTHGRVILHGRGGGAKTVILQRLWRETFPDQTVVAVYLDLKRWTPRHYEHWNQDAEATGRLHLMFSEFATPAVGATELDELPPRVQRLLLVDGLNEVLSSTAQELLAVLDAYVRLAIATRVIVADRLSRREFAPTGHWRLATLLPLSDDQIRAAFRQRLGSAELFDQASQSTKALLTTPYYLNAALQEGRTFALGSEVHRDYFVKYTSLSPEELSSVAAAAFNAYTVNRSRMFSLREFEEDAGGEVLRKLREAGAVHTIDGSAYFTHHLKHDYLAAVHLSRDARLWNYRSFTAVTLVASSFDVLALTLELVGSTNLTERFVRSVYDWNLYGVAYAVAEALLNGIQTLAHETEVWILAMLAERRWDIIYSTAKRSQDALSLFPTDTAKRMLEAPSLAEVFRGVEEVRSENDEFLAWRRIFTTPPGTEVQPALLQWLEEQESLLGWTSANVLKRVNIPAAIVAELCESLGAQKPAEIQWRIVHVLGSCPTEFVAETLFGVLSGKYDLWVRYGAIRSLLEIAARGEVDLRKRVFAEIVNRAVEISREDRILQELRNALRIRPEIAPPDWRSKALAAVRAMKAADAERRQDLERLELDIAVTYGRGERG